MKSLHIATYECEILRNALRHVYPDCSLKERYDGTSFLVQPFNVITGIGYITPTVTQKGKNENYGEFVSRTYKKVFLRLIRSRAEYLAKNAKDAGKTFTDRMIEN